MGIGASSHRRREGRGREGEGSRRSLTGGRAGQREESGPEQGEGRRMGEKSGVGVGRRGSMTAGH